MGLVTELGLDACLQAKCSFSRVLVDLQFFLLGLLCFLFVCLLQWSSLLHLGFL